MKGICADNMFIPQFEQRFATLSLFSVHRALNRRADVFAYQPPDKQHLAVGYRVQYLKGKYVAEPWVFLVPNALKSVGVEITERPDKAIYFGSIVPDDLIKQYGTLAPSLMLGNLHLLKQNAFRLVSY